MRSRRILALFAVVACLVLTGCASSVRPADPAPTKSSPAPRPSPSPTDAGRLLVTLDGVTYVHSGEQDDGSYADSAGLLALLTEVAGTAPAVAKIDDLPGYSFNLTSYKWAGMTVLSDGTTGSIAVTASTLNGVPVQTEQGLSIGSTRAEVLDAHGEFVYASGGSDQYALNPREAPGTQSLAHPGSVGADFILFVVNGDTVTELQSPSNDYGDV